MARKKRQQQTSTETAWTETLEMAVNCVVDAADIIRDELTKRGATKLDAKELAGVEKYVSVLRADADDLWKVASGGE